MKFDLKVAYDEENGWGESEKEGLRKWLIAQFERDDSAELYFLAPTPIWVVMDNCWREVAMTSSAVWRASSEGTSPIIVGQRWWDNGMQGVTGLNPTHALALLIMIGKAVGVGEGNERYEQARNRAITRMVLEQWFVLDKVRGYMIESAGDVEKLALIGTDLLVMLDGKWRKSNGELVSDEEVTQAVTYKNGVVLTWRD